MFQETIAAGTALVLCISPTAWLAQHCLQVNNYSSKTLRCP